MAWEGKIRAVEAVGVRKQQVVESEHLMQALLEQKDGLARRIFTMAGDGWHQWTYNRLASGRSVDNARRQKKQMNDDFQQLFTNIYYPLVN
uniref:chaperone protein ClpB4, mitochondrial-like n=1 Tax=Fragaria vesca subsp. vesca TaxID=101020 RepID=UPI0005CA36C6|nr:PREDICTED: chaperone protein ClpB4, mitochondrial-like [Fragaria vesca subsp. vesca]